MRSALLVEAEVSSSLALEAAHMLIHAAVLAWPVGSWVSVFPPLLVVV